MLSFWNERYGKSEYAYGVEPNEFLKEQLTLLKPGKILFPAEGEGRNAVYAARCGWKVSAFDQSEEGRNKAIKLAEKNHVHIDYFFGSFGSLPYKPEEFDAIALIYAHFPGDVKMKFLKELTNYLKPGGTIIFEAFSKEHIGYNTKNEAVGGPKDLSVLYSTNEVSEVFSNFDVKELGQEEVDLNEGLYHIGLGSVVRFVGTKL